MLWAFTPCHDVDNSGKLRGFLVQLPGFVVHAVRSLSVEFREHALHTQYACVLCCAAGMSDFGITTWAQQPYSHDFAVGSNRPRKVRRNN
jgi:hypothetical protein